MESTLAGSHNSNLPAGVTRLRVAAVTGGKSLPSARFRVRQYIEKLGSQGVDLTEYAAPLGMYPPKSKWLRPCWVTASLLARLPAIAATHKYDLVLLQREMLSTFVTLERLTKRPRVLDVDDAIWVHRRGKFAEALAKQCDGIICGNAFLADHFGRWNSRVTIIPTGVDTDRFVPHHVVDEPVIGWSGTSGGFKYLYNIENALAAVLKELPAAKLRIVSDSTPQFRAIHPNRIEFIRWSPENEVSAVQGMAVGIMPLEDSPWERGKCSFKMLTYMSCGLPVVVSPVGMNAEILSQGDSGLAARTTDDWVDSLLFLLRDGRKRTELGSNGRRLAVERYSTDVIAPVLAQTLRLAAA